MLCLSFVMAICVSKSYICVLRYVGLKLDLIFCWCCYNDHPNLVCVILISETYTILGAHMNVSFIIKMNILVLIKSIIHVPQL